MEDVTGVFDHYRITVRSIWNTGFWPDPAFQDWEAQERFEEVSRILFDELVLTKLDLEWQISDIFRKPMPFFRIQPTSDYGCPVMIDREGDALTGGGVWNDPVNRLRPLEAELHFIQFRLGQDELHRPPALHGRHRGLRSAASFGGTTRSH